MIFSYRYFFKIFSIITVFCLCPITGRAQDSSTGAKVPIELTRGVDVLTVELDGTYIAETKDEKTLLEESGRDRISQQSFTFNDKLSTVEILKAETIKKDGRRISVKPEQIRLQVEPASIGAPMFTTSKVKTIIFPDVEVGDRVFYHVRRTQQVAPLPGQFSYLDYFTPDSQVRDYKLVLNTPELMSMHFSQQGMVELAERTLNGRKIRSWTFQQRRPRSVDDGKANMLLHEPHFMISSMDSWQRLAVAYQARAKDKVVVTPEIQRLADEVTRGTSDRREQARKLYEWVRDNIRYVAIYVADGGYVPHFSEEILHNRYGDCKDHVVLLEALLKAKGIASYGALVSTGSNFLQTPVPVAESFNHIITYVPEFDLYVDATQQYVPFGEIGFLLSSKPALHTEGLEQIVLTPALEAQSNQYLSTLKVALMSDGALKGQAIQLSSGSISHYVRNWVASLPPLARREIINKSLSNQGLQGSGTLEFDQPNSNKSRFQTTVDFDIQESQLDFSRPEVLPISSPVTIADTIENATAFAYERPDEQFPNLCMAVDLTENYELVLPEQTKVLFMPQAVDIAVGPASYKATYLQSGKIINVKRHYRMAIDKGYCTPQEIEQMRPVAKAAQKDISARLMLEPDLAAE